MLRYTYPLDLEPHCRGVRFSIYHPSDKGTMFLIRYENGTLQISVTDEYCRLHNIRFASDRSVEPTIITLPI